MNETIGKRIAHHRKRLGLTQDQLAERLGVTAQAVSKWENDQSCPDIATLPRLAEIFGVSTDELLGLAPKQPVHEAEVVDDEEEDGIHIQKGLWEMKWDGGRKSGLAFGIYILVLGMLLLADAILQWNVGFWSIAWPSFLLVMGTAGLTKRFNFFSLACTLFGGYYLISNLGFLHLDIGGELIFPVILVLFGISLLMDAMKRPKKPRFRITHKNGHASQGDHTPKSTCTTDGETADCNLAFGDGVHTIDLPRLSHADINCSFGDLTVDFSGCEEVSEDCTVDASCSFGNLTLLIPKRFRVVPDTSTVFADANFQGTPDPMPAGTIRLDGSASFGGITVRYI